MLLKKLFYISLALCVLTVFSASAAFSLDMNEGDWEVTMTTSMQGLPFQMPPQTYTMTQCLTKQDMAPHDRSKKNCVIKDQKTVGNTYYWKVICEDKSGRTEGEGRITYSGATYDGTINARLTDNARGGASMTMATKMNGRYLGPCSAKTKAEADRRKAQSK
jgi:hypothetical protein